MSEHTDSRPRLYADTAFWGMTATQLFGAFNDNLFKQLMLLLAVPVGIGSVFEQDQQGLATIVFSLPFVLFSGYAGFLADRFSKLAIIFGTAAAGFLGDWFLDPDTPLEMTAHRMWIGSAFCIGIAVVGTLTSLLVRWVPPAQPDLRFRWSALTLPPESRRVLRQDPPLLTAILATCVFWLVSGVAIQAINSLGLVQLEVGKLKTSIMTAIIGLGIALGAVIAGKLCRGRANPRVVKVGAWGLFLLFVLLSISRPGGVHVLGYTGSLAALVLTGIAAGFFAIPVQVLIQARPPDGLKGRMIAVMNQTNFFAIMVSGLVYYAFDWIVEGLDWPRSAIFAMMAVLLLPVAVFYRLPDDA